MESHTNEEIAAIRNPVTYKEAQAEQELNDTKYIHEFKNDGFDWFAVDENGEAREHKTRPYIRIDTTDWWDSGLSILVISDYTGDWRESLQERIVIDEQEGCKITELKERVPSTRDKLIAMLNDNEAMEAIALEACLEQQKVIDKAKQIKVAEAAQQALDDKTDNTINGLEHLYNLGFLTLPEGYL